MLVFRIEDTEGKGPYSSKNDEAFDIFKYHVSPDCMGIKIPSKNYIFSWSSMKLLKKHINPEGKKRLHTSKIWKLSVYNVRKKYCIIMPDGQIAFDKNKAKLIEKIAIRKINLIKRYN